MVSKKKKIAIQKKSSLNIFLKKYDRDIGLILVPIILFVIFQILGIYQNKIQRDASITSFTSESFKIPVSDYTFFNHPITPPISAEAAIIMDRDSKTVLYSKNLNLRFSMASTTKLMTALVAVEYFKPQDILVAKTSHVEGVNVGVEIGDRLYFKDALYAMLLPSGNDIAYLMAQNYPSGEEAFIKAMNNKALSLHLKNTHYVDPAGLDDDGNYTTASELAQLAAYVSQNQIIADVTATKSKIIQTVDETKTFTLTNLNQLLGLYGVIGMKTGHTEGAGDVLITSAVDNGHTYILVVMRSQDRFADTEMLLSPLVAGVNSFSPRTFVN